MSEQEKNRSSFSSGMLGQYARGELSAAERHAIEKAALEDPFLADAIEGLERQVKKDPAFNFNDDVLELKKKLSKHRKRVLPAWWQAAAAILVLGVVGISGYFLLRQSSNITQPVIASRQEARKNTDTAPPAKPQEEIPPAPEQSKPFIPKVQNKKQTDMPVIASPAMAPAVAADSRVERESDPAFSKADSAVVDDKDVVQQLQGKASGLTTSRAKNKDHFVHGQVTDGTGHPVSGAIIKSNKQGATTDQNGYYSFYLYQGDSVDVSAVGFQSQKARIGLADSSRNIIALKPSRESLSEVVVTGYSAQRSKNAKELNYHTSSEASLSDSLIDKYAFPSTGWKTFQTYVDSNINLDKLDSTLHGEEMISFMVAADGRLSDFRIEESISEAHDAEAERLIRSGPAWRISKGKKQRATVVIKF